MADPAQGLMVFGYKHFFVGALCLEVAIIFGIPAGLSTVQISPRFAYAVVTLTRCPKVFHERAEYKLHVLFSSKIGIFN